MATDLLLETLSLMKQKPEGQGVCTFGVCEWLPSPALSDHSSPSILGSFQRVGREGSGGTDPRGGQDEQGCEGQKEEREASKTPRTCVTVRAPQGLEASPSPWNVWH